MIVDSEQYVSLINEIKTFLSDVYSESYHLSDNQLLALYVNDGRDVMNSFSIRYNYAFSNDSQWFICRGTNNPYQILIYNMRSLSEPQMTIDFDNKIELLRCFFLPNSMYAAVIVVDSKGIYFYYIELDALKKEKQLLSYAEIDSKLKLLDFKLYNSKASLRNFFNTQDIFINFSTSLHSDEVAQTSRSYEPLDPKYLHIGIGTKLQGMRYLLMSVELNMLNNPLSQLLPRTPKNRSEHILITEIRRYIKECPDDSSAQMKYTVTDNSSYIFVQSAPSEYVLMKIEYNMIERLRKRKKLPKNSSGFDNVLTLIRELGISLESKSYSKIVLQPEEYQIEAVGGNPLHLYIQSSSSICYIDASDPAQTRHKIIGFSQEMKVMRLAIYHNTLLEVVLRDGFVNYLLISGQYYLYYKGIDQILYVSKRLDFLIRRSTKKQLYRVPLNLPSELISYKHDMMQGIECDKRGLQIYRQHITDPVFETNRWLILHPIHQCIYLDLPSSFRAVDHNRVVHSIHSSFIFVQQAESLYVANFMNRLVYLVCPLLKLEKAVMSDDGYHVIIYSSTEATVFNVMENAAVLTVPYQASVPVAPVEKEDPHVYESILIEETIPIMMKKRTTKKKLTNIFLSAPPMTINQEVKTFSTLDSTYLLTAERTSESLHKGQMANITISWIRPNRLFEELNDKPVKEKWSTYLQREFTNFCCEKMFAKELEEESTQIEAYKDKYQFLPNQTQAQRKETLEKLRAAIASNCSTRMKSVKLQMIGKYDQAQKNKKALRERLTDVKQKLDREAFQPINFNKRARELKEKIRVYEGQINQIDIENDRRTENKTGAYFPWFIEVINEANIVRGFFEHLQRQVFLHRNLNGLIAHQSSLFDDGAKVTTESSGEQLIHSAIRESIFREASKYLQYEIKELKLIEKVESLIIENRLSSSSIITFKLYGDIPFTSLDYDFELHEDRAILFKARDTMLLHNFKTGKQLRFDHMVYDTSQRRMSPDFKYVCIQHREGIDIYDVANDETFTIDKGNFVSICLGSDRMIAVRTDYSIVIYGIKERQVLITKQVAPNSFVTCFKECLYSMACSRDFVFYSSFNFAQHQDTLQPILQQFLREFVIANNQPLLQTDISRGIAKLISNETVGVILKRPVLLVIIYNLDITEAFELFIEYVGFQNAVKNLKLISLFYHKQAKPNMRQRILQLVISYYDVHKLPLKVDQTEMRSLILNYKSALVREENFRTLFSKLVISPIGSEISCQSLDGKYLSRLVVPEKEALTIERFDKNLLESLEQLKDKRSVDISKYQPHISLIKLDLTPGSEFSFILFEVMDRMDTVSLKTILKPIIYHKWASVFKFATCYTFIFWITTALAYIYFGYFFDLLPIGVVLAFLNLLLILYEAKCWFSIGTKKYASSIWNLTDIVIQTYCMCASILFIVNFESGEFLPTLVLNWIRVTVVPLLLVRAITWLRIFSPTRYLITMVLQVFLDIRPFLIILTTVIFTFSYMWRISVNLIAPNRGEEQTFYEALYSGVFIIFGSSPDYQDDKPYDLIRFIVLIFGNVVLALTMLNFLIAIISGTFENISEDKDLYDVKELITLIKDFDSFFSDWQRLTTRDDAYFASIIDSSLLEKPDHSIGASDKAQISFDQIVSKIDSMDAKIEQLRKSAQTRAN